jgi:uncharacterized lipoprotein YddW (UPF0748 family)
VDGIQGDDRLPAQPVEGGYSEYTIELYLSQHDKEFPPLNYRDPDWQKWRAEQLNKFAETVYHRTKALKPDIQVSWAPSAYPWAYNEYLQDWPSWIRGRYADLVHPQLYRYTLEEYYETVDSQHPDIIRIPDTFSPVYPGILMNVGDYIMDADYLLKAVAYNRKRGYNGEVFFFYEGLRKNNDLLADTLLSTHYKKPAKLPFKLTGN